MMYWSDSKNQVFNLKQFFYNLTRPYKIVALKQTNFKLLREVQIVTKKQKGKKRKKEKNNKLIFYDVATYLPLRTRSERMLFRAVGCKAASGYLFAFPVS